MNSESQASLSFYIYVYSYLYVWQKSIDSQIPTSEELNFLFIKVTDIPSKNYWIHSQTSFQDRIKIRESNFHPLSTSSRKGASIYSVISVSSFFTLIFAQITKP